MDRLYPHYFVLTSQDKMPGGYFLKNGSTLTFLKN